MHAVAVASYNRKKCQYIQLEASTAHKLITASYNLQIARSVSISKLEACTAHRLIAASYNRKKCQHIKARGFTAHRLIAAS